MKLNAMTLGGALAAALLAGCSVGPDYVRPAVETPAAYKEAGNWKPAEPRDDVNRGKWWEVFNDPLLDQLQAQVDISNQNLAKAEAQFRQALALLQSVRAGYYPAVTGGVSTTRSRASATTIATPSVAPVSRGVVTNHSIPFQASWAPDVWGNIRRAVEANEAGAEASAGDLAAARLSAQAALAQSYFQLRALDAQQLLLEDTVTAYGKSLKLVQNQYAAGVVAKADLVQAQTQIKTTQAQAIDIGVQRAQLEHAIALLVGKPPSALSIARQPLEAEVPPAPAGLPSELLERRPDIAAAERRMAQANAQIGVATAAYFPSLTLSASGGYQSAAMADWLTAPSRFWSFGTAIAQTLFDGGLRRAQTAQAIAAYDASVAAYRQTVLTGFQQVEDSLATLRILEQEAEVQGEAVKLAEQALALALNQYKAGTVDYLNVVVAQATALANQRTAVDLLSRRMSASVQLVTALGGGWTPPPEELTGRNASGSGRDALGAATGK
ncbi:MAG TPA: efflux transporter outer membrane subunit [Burkholderiales bacterium]